MYCESDTNSSDSTSEISDYPCPFCHPDFINQQEEVIEHMEVWSGTDPEPEVLKMIWPYCKQTFETYDKIEKPITIHIMRQIRNLHNQSQDQKELIVPMNISYEHTLN